MSERLTELQRQADFKEAMRELAQWKEQVECVVGGDEFGGCAMTDLYVPGIPASVNRYYVCSERLRRRGWRGVGNHWWMPGQKATGLEDTFAFGEALSMSGIGRFYDWQVTKLFTERMSVKIRADLTPAFRAMKKAARSLTEKLEVAGYKLEN